MNEFIHSISKNNQRVISGDNVSRKGSRKGNLADEAHEKIVNEHDEALKNVEKIASVYNLNLTSQSDTGTTYSRDAVSVDGERYPYGKVDLRAWGYGYSTGGTILLEIWYKQSEFDFAGRKEQFSFDKNTSSIDIQSELDKLGLKFN